MKRVKSIRWQFILMMFLVLFATGFIALLLLIIVAKLGWLKYVNASPWFRVALVLLASTIIGLIISMIISERVLKPIQNLSEATKEVSKGNFAVSVLNPYKKNELYDLCANFNKMAQELQNVEIVHNDFITNFSHEFKTPIMSIQGFAKQLQSTNLSEQERYEFSQIIIEESRRLAQLSSNILELANLENQESIRLKKNTYFLDEQLRQCLLVLQKEWELKQLKLSLKLERLEFEGDQEMMTSLWLNILHNAIKFSLPEGDLTVACYGLGNELKVKISDTGVGMTDDEQDHIFDKFYQGDNSHQSHGSGLGLPIAYRIAKQHQGKISVKSQKGLGTTFTVHLHKKA